MNLEVYKDDACMKIGFKIGEKAQFLRSQNVAK